ncbi:hypothetical protein BaRGS_00008236 [Batillaria attramentaria]|uniref:Secreted protein n=1 Tax=Batillaria attramentaria TaxID=370345 RepID=A0ABD0LN37_9CAEN
MSRDALTPLAFSTARGARALRSCICLALTARQVPLSGNIDGAVTSNATRKTSVTFKSHDYNEFVRQETPFKTAPWLLRATYNGGTAGRWKTNKSIFNGAM